MGQSTSKGSGLDQMRGGHSARSPLSDTDRVILWEVNIARGCLDSFNKMLTAHAIVLSLLVTVNLVGFLQPPRGWAGDSGHMFRSSKSLIAFSVANSASLYTATSGLLFYIYCSISAIVTFQSVPLPNCFDDHLSADLLGNIRASLRRVALPSIKRRCAYLFSFLACSLIFCMISYISAGIASMNPHNRLIGVILPAIPGCVIMLILLHIAAAKLRLELDFNTRFRKLWSTMGPNIQDPGVWQLEKETIHALDPLPHIFSWYYHSRGDDEESLLAGSPV